MCPSTWTPCKHSLSVQPLSCRPIMLAGDSLSLWLVMLQPAGSLFIVQATLCTSSWQRVTAAGRRPISHCVQAKFPITQQIRRQKDDFKDRHSFYGNFIVLLRVVLIALAHFRFNISRHAINISTCFSTYLPSELLLSSLPLLFLFSHSYFKQCHFSFW